MTKTYIVGAEKGSADYQYCATEKFLNGTCNIHDAETQDEEKPEEEPADPPDDANRKKHMNRNRYRRRMRNDTKENRIYASGLYRRRG